MSMTRKDFEAVAHAMRYARSDALQDSGRKLIDGATERLANEFQHANPRFDRERFLLAAEWGE